MPAGLDRCQALLLYAGPARQLVTSLKYRNDRRALSWLVDAAAPLLSPDPDAVVTWVPTTPDRRRRRGFDQAALVARGLARRWGLPCVDVLERRAGRPQTGRSVAERHQGVDFAIRRRHGPTTRPVVLIDDVVTTGATLRDAALAIRRSGASNVSAVVLARTPRTGANDSAR